MDGTPTILVAGVVPRLDRLRVLGRLKRADWGAVVRESARPGVALAILGHSPTHVDMHAVIDALRRDAAASRVPLLHIGASDAGCERCRADVCLPADVRSQTVLGVARTLLGARRTRPRQWPVSRSDAPLLFDAHLLGLDAGPPAPEPLREPSASQVLPRLVEAVPGIVFLYDVDAGRLDYVSPAVERVLGYPPAALEAMTAAAAASLVHQEDRERLAALPQQARAAAPCEVELRTRTADGRWRTLRARLVVLGSGSARLIGVATDVTEERDTSRMLERAQRFDALGHLAGGIAHDFNNILGVITGHSQLTQQLLPRDHPASAGLEQVVKASERAAALTQQLLALSRVPNRAPRALDLNLVVTGVAAMLQRVIAERVEFDLRQAPQLGSVRADPTQIEQILINLALNARDAMPAGGRLAIETRDSLLDEAEARALDLAPGRYAVLAVSDSGTGMDEATRRRIFEPFFTTKPEGRGTGLGLATVHGIVERCGGAIRVESAPGAGTRFEILLPCAESSASAGVEPAAGRRLEGRETILLVEDADSVRDVTRELLEGLGYTVLAAAHGAEALALARTHQGPIQVLLTDMVMPRIGGSTLAAEVEALRPQIRVVYMSGYPSEALSDALGEKHDLLLQKPFTRDRLGQAIRQAIDGVAASSR